jgi:hypothetical protein
MAVSSHWRAALAGARASATRTGAPQQPMRTTQLRTSPRIGTQPEPSIEKMRPERTWTGKRFPLRAGLFGWMYYGAFLALTSSLDKEERGHVHLGASSGRRRTSPGLGRLTAKGGRAGLTSRRPLPAAYASCRPDPSGRGSMGGEAMGPRHRRRRRRIRGTSLPIRRCSPTTRDGWE